MLIDLIYFLILKQYCNDIGDFYYIDDPFEWNFWIS